MKNLAKYENLTQYEMAGKKGSIHLMQIFRFDFIFFGF